MSNGKLWTHSSWRKVSFVAGVIWPRGDWIEWIFQIRVHEQSVKISTPESFTVQFQNLHFFFIIPLCRLVLKKVLQKVAVKNLSTKSNAQLSGIKFRCALMRPSRASLAHATVNLTSLHWSLVLIGCTSFNYWVDSFATYAFRGTQWICSSKYLFLRHIFAGWEMWKK